MGVFFVLPRSHNFKPVYKIEQRKPMPWADAKPDFIPPEMNNATTSVN